MYSGDYAEHEDETLGHHRTDARHRHFRDGSFGPVAVRAEPVPRSDDGHSLGFCHQYTGIPAQAAQAVHQSD
ncbi:hypothetical protein D3C73_1588420 [compost metagenome]